MCLLSFLAIFAGIFYTPIYFLEKHNGHDSNPKITEKVKLEAEKRCREHGGLVYVQIIPFSVINYEAQCKYKNISFNTEGSKETFYEAHMNLSPSLLSNLI